MFEVYFTDYTNRDDDYRLGLWSLIVSRYFCVPELDIEVLYSYNGFITEC